MATGLLHELPDRFDYRFSHALVRDALYAELGRLDKARLHLRAGEAIAHFWGRALDALGPGDPYWAGRSERLLDGGSGGR